MGEDVRFDFVKWMVMAAGMKKIINKISQSETSPSPAQIKIRHLPHQNEEGVDCYGWKKKKRQPSQCQHLFIYAGSALQILYLLGVVSFLGTGSFARLIEAVLKYLRMESLFFFGSRSH